MNDVARCPVTLAAWIAARTPLLFVYCCDREGLPGWGSCRDGHRTASPTDAFLATDPGAFTALCREHVRVAGVGAAPPQVGVQHPGLRRGDGEVGVGGGELAQWPVVRLERGGPGGAGVL